MNILPITWQSFAAIGDLAAKKRKEKMKETSAVKHKTAGNYRPGRRNKRLNGLTENDGHEIDGHEIDGPSVQA